MITGETATCDMCGKTYKYFIWSMGSDRCLCRNCVSLRPSAHLSNIDAIDLEREHDIISEEIETQQRKDYPFDRPVSRNRKRVYKPTGKDFEKAWKIQEKKTIAKFRKEHAKDVGLGYD